MSASALGIEAWAEAEFGSVELGDPRRRSRLTGIATAVAQSPAGTVTRVFTAPKDREGAYRFLESDNIDAREIARGATRACLERTKGMAFFFVPVDASSLTLTDPSGEKGLGRVGNRKVKSRGLEVMSALGVAPDGTPLGYCGQHYWARAETALKTLSCRRAFEDRESRYWLDAVELVESERLKVPGSARPWYQVDRGADFKEFLFWQATASAYVTFRASQDRRVRDARGKYLWSVMQKAQVACCLRLNVPRGHGRRERVATLELRSAEVILKLQYRGSAKLVDIPIRAVLATEVSALPRDEEPIEWLLLTNHPVETATQARLVLKGYSYRWRIEEFHERGRPPAASRMPSCEALPQWSAGLLPWPSWPPESSD